MIHQIQNRYLTVDVAEHGAELQSILDRDGTQYLWQGDAAYWTGRAPNLFPYVARLAQGRYVMDGRLYQMAIHGFAPYLDFTVEDKRDSRLVMKLASSGETRAAYPREFVFRVGYELREHELSVTYTVENRDERRMYFGLGAHPGLRVPLERGGRFEDYRLRFDAPCRPRRVGFTEDCLLDGTDAPFPLEQDRFLPLRHALFDDDAIVLKDAGHRVTLESSAGRKTVSVEFPQMNYVGLWHQPKTDAPYICVEPWCSLPSSNARTAVFEEQPDLIRLAPELKKIPCIKTPPPPILSQDRMEKRGTFMRWLWYFIIYSFAGFLLETAFAQVIRHPKKDRKCLLLLPLCPVYGLGACLILWLAPRGGGPLWVALSGCLAATGAELLMGAFYRFALGVEFWNYDGMPGSFGGLVCPVFSACWTVLSLLLVYGVHPAVAGLAGAIPAALDAPALILLGADMLVSCAALRRTGTTEVLRWYA